MKITGTLDRKKLDEAARAIQRIYLNQGHPSDFSEQEIQDDFAKYRPMYAAMVVAVLKVVAVR